MAKMWPIEIPPQIQRDPKRKAECEVYRRLEEVLDDSYVVFYSRPWLGIKPDGAEVDGECDFVIAHKEYGMLAIEVKGGGISYNPQEEQWYTTNRYGVTKTIKNPVMQAMSSKHALLRKLQESSIWEPRYIRARHGVIFPDSEVINEDLGADKPRRIFCYTNDLEQNFAEWITSRFNDLSDKKIPEEPLGEDGIKALEHILARPFHLHFPLNKKLNDDDKEINTLTQQQYHILQGLEQNNRVAILGGAGTGKTILAMEQSKRYADSGMRVLLTCFNKPLALEMARKLYPQDGLQITYFHDFCLKNIRKAGLKFPDNPDPNKFFNEVLPELLIKALKILPDVRFDAIIVDEGQDFKLNWWNALEEAFDPAGKKLLRVFYDSNQQVYENAERLPIDIKQLSYRLTTNMRNTQKIYDLTEKYYKGYKIEPIGPEGVDIKWVIADSLNEVRRKLENEIEELISIEHIKPENITILGSTSQILEKIVLKNKIAGYLCKPCDEESSETIILDTIRRYKGLENQIIILIISSEIADDEELLYIATSRARAQLILIADAASTDRIKTYKYPIA